MLNALIHHCLENELQAKFLMEFCLSILLLEGRAHLQEFTDRIVLRPDLQEMIKRVDFKVDSEAEEAGYDKMAGLIRIHLDNGKIIEGRSDFGKGSPSNPFSYEEVAEKFHGCAEFARWPKTKADRIVSLVAEIDSLNDLNELTTSLPG